MPWRAFLLVLLSCLLVCMGSAQVRSSVIRAQAEAGLQRVLENEVHSSGPAMLMRETEKLGKKPYEHHDLQAGYVPCSTRVIACPTEAPLGPRAPPYATRGPPSIG